MFCELVMGWGGEDGPKKSRMAYLSIACSHTVNGVEALHTQISKATIFKETDQLYLDKSKTRRTVSRNVDGSRSAIRIFVI